MKINLLTKPGTYSQKESDDLKVDDSLISAVSLQFKKDFESAHNVESVKIKSSRKIIISYCFSVLILIFCSIYYQFIYNSKLIIKSEKLLSLVEYSNDSANLFISDILYDDHSLSVKMIYNSDSIQKDETFISKINSFSERSNLNLDVTIEDNVRFFSLNFPPFVELRGNLDQENTPRRLSKIEIVSIDSLMIKLNNILALDYVQNFHLYHNKNSGLYNLVQLDK